jgi:hypothetical protein
MTLKHQTNTGIKSSGIKKKKSAVIRPAIKKFGKRKKIRKVRLHNKKIGLRLNKIKTLQTLTSSFSMKNFDIRAW